MYIAHPTFTFCEKLTTLIAIAAPDKNPNSWTARRLYEAPSTVFSDCLQNPIGALILQRAYETADIHMVCVHPDQRRKGIAAALLHEACTWLHTQGVQAVLLEVHTNNAAAVSLYQKHGFQNIHTRAGYYRMTDGTYADAFVFERHLNRPLSSS